MKSTSSNYEMLFKLLSSSRAAPAARSHSRAVIRARAGHVRTHTCVLVHVTTRTSQNMASQSVGDGQAYTVAVIRRSDKSTVGHTSYNLAPTVSPFGPRLLESDPRSWALDIGWKSRALTDSTDVKICKPCHRRVLND